MTVSEFMERVPRVNNARWVRNQAICKDGFQLSIQQSAAHHCDSNSYEVGYPTLPIKELEEHMLGINDEVYWFVPYEKLEAVIEKHGGIVAYYNLDLDKKVMFD